MLDEDSKYLCVLCAWEQVSTARAQRCIADKMPITCPQCGEAAAKNVKHCIAPLNKSNYMYISDLSQLKQLNPKRTT